MRKVLIFSEAILEMLNVPREIPIQNKAVQRTLRAGTTVRSYPLGNDLTISSARCSCKEILFHFCSSDCRQYRSQCQICSQETEWHNILKVLILIGLSKQIHYSYRCFSPQMALITTNTWLKKFTATMSSWDLLTSKCRNEGSFSSYNNCDYRTTTA